MRDFSKISALSHKVAKKLIYFIFMTVDINPIEHRKRKLLKNVKTKNLKQKTA